MRRALLAAGALLLGAVALLPPAAGEGQNPPPAVRALPMVGVPDLQTILMGAAAAAEPQEVWAVRTLPLDTAPPRTSEGPVPFGPVGAGAGARGQLAFLRWTAATGWQVAATPVDGSDEPARGPQPNGLSLRVTPRGGALLVGRQSDRPADKQVVVIVRDPGGRFRYVTLPGPEVVDPSAAEVLATDLGAGRVAVAAFETSRRTGVYAGVLGGDREDAVARFDGTSWTREPVEVPEEVKKFRILAVAATAAGGGWLLGDDGTGGVQLFRRLDGGEPRWAPVDLGDTPLATADDVEILQGAAQPLTVAPGVVWIDGTAAGQDFTLRYDPAREQVTGTFCDDDEACEQPLGFSFASRYGYRSQAFEDGRRIVTNVAGPGASETDGEGNYAELTNDAWSVRSGGGLPFRPSGAFLAPDDGWLEGPVRISRDAPPQHLRRWPVALRAPLHSVVPEPGKAPAAAESQALAVGTDGGVARYAPGIGWQREFLLTSSGAVASPLLRGVAWPEGRRAHAVGDLGAMWIWQAETGLWERDPAAPPGFIGNLLDVAFDPADPIRGYAVGREGVLMSYDKSWTQVTLPEPYGGSDFTAIAFAGRQALVAGGPGLLVDDGDGRGWREDPEVTALLDTLPVKPRLIAVAGLPDGGAVLAGRDVVLERDGAGGEWRFAPQPLLDASPVAVAAFREDGEVRALVSLAPRLPFPQDEPLPVEDPDLPPPVLPPYAQAGDGYLVRQTATGWRDEQQTAYNASVTDRPLKSDPVLGLLVDESGQGWTVGGWSGESDSGGRGSSGRSGVAKADRSRVQTGAIRRYTTGQDGLEPPAEGDAQPDLGGEGLVRFAVAGHAQCEARCAELRDRDIAPDVTLRTAVQRVAGLRRQSGGPRFMLYTGGRLPAGAGPTGQLEGERLSEILLSGGDLPVFGALAAADSEDPGPGGLLAALGGLPAPFGSAAPPAGITPLSATGPDGSSAHTHYAFDSDGPGGAVRVIVIDNSRGSLQASDPFQSPAEPQLPWLVAALDAARARGIPSVVMGSRDLNSRATPPLNVATDADAVAKALVAGGASAYFYDRPEENRAGTIPAGAPQTIPSFGTGTLGYRSPVANAASTGKPDARFGDPAYLLAQVDMAKRDAASNRAPVSVRTIPIIGDLSLQPVDGTLLRRSRPSLFQGIGRRPISGDRWGPIAGGTPEPPGGDPYVAFPAAPCTTTGCSTRLTPEFSFESSDPDIGDFVRQDPASTNLRKPFIGPGDKVVTDAASGLFCPFNAGTTTVTIRAGGLTYSTKVTVQAGSVQRPCGTRPLNPERFVQKPAAPAVAPPPAPAGPAPASNPPPTPLVPPPPPPVPVVPPPAVAAKIAPKPPSPPIPTLPALPPLPPLTPPVPPTPDNVAGQRTQPPPPAGSFARPIPPGGATIRVTEEKREEEAAPESSSAASAYHPDEHGPIAPWLAGLAVIAAAAGASLSLGSRRRDRRMETAIAAAHPRRPPASRRHR